MDFSRINKVGKAAEFLPTKKMHELELEKDYKISNLRRVQTKWGSRIIIDIEDKFTCFLPTRFVKLFEEDTTLFAEIQAAALNNNLLMQYFGSKFNNVEFKPVQ